MSFSDWLLIGGAALLIKNGMKKEAADRKKADEEYNRYMADLVARQSEWERSRAVNIKRRNMPCFLMMAFHIQLLRKLQKEQVERSRESKM